MNIKRKARGFTLVEIMVVVIIIAMLAAFVAPRIFKGMGKTKRTIARAKMATIEDALGRFQLDCGRMPDQSEGLEALLTEPDDLDENKWDGPYLKASDLLDPWDHRYEYVEEGRQNPGMYDLVSYGADGQPGGEADYDEDIYND